MKAQAKVTRIFLLSVFLVLSALVATGNLQAQGFVGTQTCIDCHSTWQDNNPSTQDVALGRASVPDYVPINLRTPENLQHPFYSIPEGYVSSLHNITEPQFDVNPDHVKCEGCHGSGLAHFGVGPIPVPIPGLATCGGCHNNNSTGAPFFDLNDFLLTRHANGNKLPSKFFDQKKNGNKQARTSSLTPDSPGTLLLFKSDASTKVTRNERIEECSVCHNYALTYPQFIQKIAQKNMIPEPVVGCTACHDAHIPAPDGNEPEPFTVFQVTGVAGSTVVSAAPVPRSVFYLNHKPFKIAADGAQDQHNGIWTRGSAIARPTFSIVTGVGTLGVSGTDNILTFAGGGFLGKVQQFNTVFLSGTASGTVNLPADAVNAGLPVTVQATFDMNGFLVVAVRDDNTLVLGEAPTASATVTYKKKTTGTGTKSVDITFTGPINFEVRDMYTNTENLCGSCHAQGTYKFSAVGKTQGGILVDLSKTHNIDVYGQYLTSGHRNRLAPPWEEFTAFGGHQMIYPFDLSITGSGGVGSLRNRSNTSFVLTATPDVNNAFLATPGNRTLPLAASTSFDCLQCHHGLSTVDFQEDQQGTPNAQVLWGDATLVCVSCHDPHENQIDANVRIPEFLSINAQFVSANNPRGHMNKFLDGTDIPSGVGNNEICLFCHQGRESGLTVFLRFKAKGIDPYTSPDAVLGGVTLPNPHYLDSGSLVWSRNMWEFFFNNVPSSYSPGIDAHQALNCAGCHMAEASPNGLEGGHTWRPRIETCQQCHGASITAFSDIPASADYDGDGIVKTTFEEIGEVVPIPAGTPAPIPESMGGTGLFGILNRELANKGIYYNPDSRPYFFNAAGKGFDQFTSKTLGAAFDLGLAWKAGTCVPYHNAFYIVQIFQDALKALGVTPHGVRPGGASRPATDYRITQNNIPK